MSNTTIQPQERALIEELMQVLLLCEAPRSLKARAVDAVQAARKALVADDDAAWSLTPDTSTARQGWDVCARQTAGRLIDDLMKANREAAALESLLLLPLLAQARQIHQQLGAIASAIDATPEA